MVGSVLPGDVIMTALDGLVLVALASYDITRKERLLENCYRRQIVQWSKEAPGILRTEVQKRLDCARRTVHYHVDLLVARGLLRVVKIGHTRHLFHMESRVMDEMALLSESGMLGLAKAVVMHPGISLKGVTEATGLNRKTLRKYAGRLVQERLIEEKGTERHHCYKPTPKLIQVLQEMTEAREAMMEDLTVSDRGPVVRDAGEHDAE